MRVSNGDISGKITIWKIDLDSFLPHSTFLQRYITEDESQEAFRQVSERSTKRVIVSKALTRLILGLRLEKEPHTIKFAKNEWGKPVLSAETSEVLHFNISHTAEKAVIAITDDCTVGIDIEKMRPSVKIGDISHYAFSVEEQVLLSKVPSDRRRHLFFAMWTRKEALIKAAGGSVAELIDKTLIKHDKMNGDWGPARLGGDNRRFYVKDLALFPGFSGALCAARSALPVTVKPFNTDQLR